MLYISRLHNGGHRISMGWRSEVHRNGTNTTTTVHRVGAQTYPNLHPAQHRYPGYISAETASVLYLLYYIKYHVARIYYTIIHSNIGVN